MEGNFNVFVTVLVLRLERSEIHSTTMGFFEDIRSIYGVEAVTSLKHWSNLRYKLVKVDCRKTFLLSCRRLKLIPRHIKQNFGSIYGMLMSDHPYKRSVDSILTTFQNKCLNLEIKITFWRFNRLERDIRAVIQRVRSLLPHIIIQNFIFMQDSFCDTLKQKLSTSLNFKLDRLIDTHSYLTMEENTKWLFNCTSETIPFDVCTILALGPKFIVPVEPRKVPLLEVLKDTESIVREEPSADARDEKRALATNVITNFINQSNYGKRRCSPDDKIIGMVKDAKAYLKSKPDLLVSKADKGNCTVVLYKTEYLAKMKSLLEDSNIYQLLKSDPTSTLQKEANKLIVELFNNEYISQYQKNVMVKYNCVSPKLYGLCKIHKAGFPLRPITSFVGSPGYNISRFVNDILSCLSPNFSFSIKNSSELLDKLKDVVVPHDYILVSFDAESLFTNITKQLIMRLIEDNWHIIEGSTPVDFESLVELIEFCFRSSYVSFSDQYYKQISGCPMGAPCSPIFANLAMDFILNEVRGRLNFDIPLLLIYVDDIFTMIPKNSVETVLNIFNSIDHNINFTYELENDKYSLPFLDCLIIRDPVLGTLKTDLYKKPTNTNRTINFRSLHPLYQKINIIKQSHSRILKLCSPEFVSSNLAKLRVDLKKNGYPSRLVNSVINQQHAPDVPTQPPSSSNTPLPNNDNTDKKFVKLPLIPGLSNKLCSIFKKDNLRIVFSSRNTLGRLLFSNLKDKVPKKLESNIIYKINCFNCDKSYIGTTKQYLSNRISNHKSSCSNITNNKTALVEHCLETGHSFNFAIDNVEVLHRENNYQKRLFAEMVFIKKNNCVNFRTDLDNLSAIYSSIINRLKI